MCMVPFIVIHLPVVLQQITLFLKSLQKLTSDIKISIMKEIKSTNIQFFNPIHMVWTSTYITTA